MKKEEIIERYGIEEYERRLQTNRERNRGNPKYKARKSEWQKENRDKMNAWNREQRKKNPKRAREWDKNNPLKARAFKMADNYKRVDRANGYDTKDNVSGKWIIDHIFNSTCIYCGDSDWRHLGCDRINNLLPHTPENCVCACGLCNIERNDRYTVEEFKRFRNSHPRGWDYRNYEIEVEEINGKKVLRKRNNYDKDKNLPHPVCGDWG